MLSFEQVSKFILSDVTLHIPKGVAVGIIGASGAGKTTLLRLACGLLAPEQGEVYTLQMCPVKKREVLGPRLGCLLDRMPLFDEYSSVADNFRNFQIIHRLSNAEFDAEYGFLAERFGIREFEHSLINSLSLGQRRRAELAAVLLHRPDLLLLDEPTNGLDENAKKALQEVLQERIEGGMTLVVASHTMREVSGICERIILLEQGKLLYYGEEKAFLQRYAPMDHMHMKIFGEIPDMEELPITKYRIEGEELVLSYNSNDVTAAEILEVVLKQTTIREVSIQKPDLTEVIFAIKSEKSTTEEEKTK